VLCCIKVQKILKFWVYYYLVLDGGLLKPGVSLYTNPLIVIIIISIFVSLNGGCGVREHSGLFRTMFWIKGLSP